MHLRYIACAVITFGLLQSCQKASGTSGTSARVNFTFKFDSTQATLNNIGQVAVIPMGNAASRPVLMP